MHLSSSNVLDETRKISTFLVKEYHISYMSGSKTKMLHIEIHGLYDISYIFHITHQFQYGAFWLFNLTTSVIPFNLYEYSQ
jgi:hypothetical protein